jgi:hypothetical protein
MELETVIGAEGDDSKGFCAAVKFPQNQRRGSMKYAQGKQATGAEFTLILDGKITKA